MSTEISQFTEGARSALSAARAAAERLGHQSVETDHLLIGIASEQSGPAGRALREAGANPARIESAMREYRPVRAPHEGPVDLSPAVQRLLERAAQEAGGELTTEHLLQALLQEKKGLAHMALRQMSIAADTVVRRMKVYAEHRQGGGKTIPFDRARRATAKPEEPPKFRTGRQIAASRPTPRLGGRFLSGGSPLVTLLISALMALGGYVIVAILVQSVIPALVGTSGAGFGVALAFAVVGLAVALIVPPLLAWRAAQETALSYRSTPWGHVGAAAYRLRLWFVGLVAASPLVLWALGWLAGQMAGMPTGIVVTSVTNLIMTLLGLGFFGVTVGVGMAGRLRDASRASLNAALITLAGMWLVLGLVVISMGLGWGFKAQALIRLFAPLVAFGAGLAMVKRSERWM